MPLGRMRRLKGNSLPAWPRSPLAATLTRLALGFLFPLVSGGLVAGRRSRRARTSLLRTANSLWIGSVVESLFRFRRTISHPTTGGNIFALQINSEKWMAARQEVSGVIHRDWLSASDAEGCGVDNAVEK